MKIAAAALALLLALVSQAQAETLKTHANGMAEASFTSSKTYADPFNEVEVDAVFTTPSGKELRVPAFWSGGQTRRVRYASPEAGVHRFRTVCTDPANDSLHGIEGSVEVTPYTGDNPLYRHGPIRVAANRRHFEHADGRPFFWLGDTWWMGLTKRLTWPEEFDALTKDRAGKGFTVVQIVAGLYPDMPAFDERGANEVGFPWEKDYARINAAYFDAADRRIGHLVDSGIAPCIVGAWGYHLPWLGEERMKKHWRYLIARYGAYPTFWCIAGEGAMPYYLSQDKAKETEFQKRGWTEIAKYVRETDPFDRPITIHPTDMSRNQVTDPSLLDFEMLQTGHGDRASIQPTFNLVRASRAAQPAMPTINAEVCYEGILGTCPAEIQRLMAWTCLLSGTAGHTYGANGIWQVNRKEQAYGPSPHGGNYGTTPWDEAMRLPGSAQTGYAGKLLLRFAWHKFEPHPEWAAFEDERDEIRVRWGDWIWFDEGAATDAPIARRRFRKTFDVRSDAKITGAVIHLSADDRFTAYVNGEKIGGLKGWESPRRFDIVPLLKPGRNVLAVEAENVASNVTKNPAGLICAGEVTYVDADQTSLSSDATWKASDALADEQWTTTRFTDEQWRPAKVLAKYAEAPWGKLQERGVEIPPFAAGIPGEVRVIYLSQPRTIRVTSLERGVTWRGEYFDPVTGESTELPRFDIADDGSCRVAPPPAAQDWVLVLRRK